MKVDYIALSIPIFFILIGLELLIGIRKKVRLYRLNDSLTNISLGIGQQVTGIFMKTALFFGYLSLFENYRIWTIESTLLNWVLLFLGVDFFYYWFHRMSHEVNALWAAHIVHHQSEDYNLSVALRQSWFQNAFAWVFYLPLAVIGFEPVMFLTVSSFNTLYQFWIHTKTIGKLGPLEWVLNTPSHHRVHHGSDPRYLDKNHGGTLIIWDRLFGTFAEEIKEPHYGITTPLRSWNPVWANLHYWNELFGMAKQTRGLLNKILVFLKPPGWRPADLGGHMIPKEIDDSTYTKFNLSPSAPLKAYLFVQFVVVLGISVFVLFKSSEMDRLSLTILSAYVITMIALIGAMFECKSRAVTFEWIRLIATPVLFLLLPVTGGVDWVLIATSVYSLLSLAYLFKYRNALNHNQTDLEKTI